MAWEAKTPNQVEAVRIVKRYLPDYSVAFWNDWNIASMSPARMSIEVNPHFLEMLTKKEVAILLSDELAHGIAHESEMRNKMPFGSLHQHNNPIYELILMRLIRENHITKKDGEGFNRKYAAFRQRQGWQTHSPQWGWK